MSLLGKAVIVSWNKVAADMRDQFVDWHTNEHMPERLGIEGFLRGRRFEAVKADRDYFIMYETAGPEVLSSPAYLARLNAPTPWTRLVTPHMRDSIRGLCRVQCSESRGTGPMMATLRFMHDEGPAFAAAMRDLIRVKLDADPDLMGIHLCMADRPASTLKTVERENRDTAVPHAVLLIEGRSEESVGAAARAFGKGMETSIFRLQHALMAQPQNCE